MAIVVYKCDVCKRDVEIERNIKGLENIQRCTITHGCRGKLYQTKVLTDFVRGRLPDQVAGLDDWRQRKVLYDHTQTIERDNWVINHDLGTFPSVSVFINAPTEDDPDNQTEIIPTDIVIVDEDNIILNFEKALAGTAQLVARQSDPDLLRPFVGLNTTTESNLQQISINGNISFATRISTTGEEPNTLLDVIFTTTTNAIVQNVYSVSGNAVGLWSDTDKVIIKGKSYLVRSFNANGLAAMADETISFGSTFIFNGLGYNTPGSPVLLETHRPIPKDEMYILFGDSPFDAVDKVTTQYVDVYDAAILDSNNKFVYDADEFFVDKEIIQDTYPPIRPVQT